jgi:hypothetical protein
MENIERNELRRLDAAEFEKSNPAPKPEGWEEDQKHKVSIWLNRYLRKGLLIRFGSDAVLPLTTAFEIVFPYAFALYVIFALLRAS